VAAEIEGPLDENHYVVDFIALRDTLRDLTAQLDHRVILPTGHRKIKVVADPREVTATFDDRRWVFPRGDCVLLPVPNTTAEQLARYLAGQLIEALAERTGMQPQIVRVFVDECDGQVGACELRS
jgi:6-pyruvoyltetrahydropterin/6-carboxytetrahydropterin synthase